MARLGAGSGESLVGVCHYYSDVCVTSLSHGFMCMLKGTV